jgi:hypothetical protein
MSTWREEAGNQLAAIIEARDQFDSNSDVTQLADRLRASLVWIAKPQAPSDTDEMFEFLDWLSHIHPLVDGIANLYDAKRLRAGEFKRAKNTGVKAMHDLIDYLQRLPRVKGAQTEAVT